MAEDLPPPYSPPIMANDSAVLRAWACWILWQVKMPVNLPPQLASMADDTDAHRALARWIFDVYGEGGMGGFDGGMGGKGALDGDMGKGGMGAFDGGKGKGGMGGLGALDGGMGGKGEKGDVLDDGSGATDAGMGGSLDGGCRPAQTRLTGVGGKGEVKHQERGSKGRQRTWSGKGSALHGGKPGKDGKEKGGKGAKVTKARTFGKLPRGSVGRSIASTRADPFGLFEGSTDAAADDPYSDHTSDFDLLRGVWATDDSSDCETPATRETPATQPIRYSDHTSDFDLLRGVWANDDSSDCEIVEPLFESRRRPAQMPAQTRRPAQMPAQTRRPPSQDAAAGQLRRGSRLAGVRAVLV